MITINIVAGPHCALKSSWFRRFFHDTYCLSAETFYDWLAEERILHFDNYLEKNFENIWMNAVVEIIKNAPDDFSIAVDGATLNNDPLAYNFSYAEGVQRFIDIVRDAKAKGAITKPFCFVIHWLALPLPLRQLLNHRREKPYPTDWLRHVVYWDSEPKDPDIKIAIHNTDDVFNAFYVTEP